jgi:aspartate/methionine/tyrosine aminotransferase
LDGKAGSAIFDGKECLVGLFAQRVGRIDTENAFKVGPYIRQLEEQGKRIIKCNLGEPDFPVPQPIKDEVKRQLDKDNTHYCDPQGILPLRQAVARHFRETRGIPATPDRVVVFPGAKPPIGFSQQTYCDPGDEVVYPSPGFPIYESFIAYVGAVPKPLHLDEARGFSFAGADLAPLLSPRTKLIYLCFPSNPTGGVASEAQLQEIAAVIRERCGPEVRVYADEVYEDILFDGSAHRSIASCPGMAERTILVSGASKSFAWTGGRIGWALFPTREEAEAFRTLNINYFSCIPAYNQEGARCGLESPAVAKEVAERAAVFQARRDLVVTGLNAIPGVRCQNPKGAFYVFPNIAGVCQALGILEAFPHLPPAVQQKTSPSTLFQLFLLFEHGVATLDRKSFGRLGTEGRHFLRISIATDTDALKEGLKRFAAAASDRAGFQRFVEKGEHLF